jgi:dienelactone hydrolase
MTAAAAAGGVGTLGKFWVGQRWITFTEPAHTGPTGEHLGPRELLTQIRYPLAGPPSKTSRPARGPLPLIVFGPGFMQCGAPYSRLLRAWATAGYVVAAVNFPRSDCKVGSAATESDMVNQPADMSYVITRMLALSAGHRGLFSGLISPHQIAVTGQSDGGDTVAAVAANTCCSDHRVAAIAVLSGAEWPAMPGSFFTRRPAPMLFTQGSADTVNLPGCSAAMYHADPARMRFYLDLFGADHTGPYWGTNRFERIVARVSLAFFDRFVLGQAAAGPAMKRAGDVPNLAALFSHGHGSVPDGPCIT